MEYKVLFTGSAGNAIDGLIGYVPSTCRVYRCPPTPSKLLEALSRYHPHILVAVLTDETRSALRMYIELDTYDEYRYVSVLAVGSQEACDEFKNCVFLPNIRTLVRPISMEDFNRAVKESIAEITAREQELAAAREAKEAEKRARKEREEEEAREKERARRVEETNKNGRKSILVVDDDVRMLNVIKMYLEELYDITLVPNGKLALKFLSKKKADLVLLDYLMPGEDGPTVLKRIREESPVPDIPVIFLTGVSEKGMVLRGLELCPDGYILKPVKKEVLLDKVIEVLLGLK